MKTKHAPLLVDLNLPQYVVDQYRTKKVLGMPEKASSLYDLFLAMSWVATEQDNLDIQYVKKGKTMILINKFLKKYSDYKLRA